MPGARGPGAWRTAGVQGWGPKHMDWDPTRCLNSQATPPHSTMVQGPPPLFSPITHQRITVAPWLWPNNSAKPSRRLSVTERELPSRPQSARLKRTPAPSSGQPPWRPSSARARLPAPSNQAPTEPQLVPRPPVAPAVQHAGHSLVVHAPAYTTPADQLSKLHSRSRTFAQDAEDAGSTVQLLWRDPLLLELTEADDLEVLLLRESRLVAARETRDNCLAELKTHLQEQKYNRDRVRAHGGAGRDALRDTLRHSVRTKRRSNDSQTPRPLRQPSPRPLRQPSPRPLRQPSPRPMTRAARVAARAR
jgi:hypothetical protein